MPGPLSKVVHGINSNLIRHILTKVLMLKCLVSGVDFFLVLRPALEGQAKWADWKLRIRVREQMALNLVYWKAVKEGRNLEMLVLDVVKSYDRKTFRDDGKLPPSEAQLLGAAITH